MRTARALSSHTPFSSKSQSLLLSNRSTRKFPNAKTLGEDETLSKCSPDQSPRNSSATKMSLRPRDPADYVSQRDRVPQMPESIRKNDSPQTSSESTIHMRNSLLSTKATAKWEQTFEGASSDKASEPPRSRKASEDTTGYNTRKQSKASGSLGETEDTKSQNATKKSVGDIMANQQTSGYHLRNTGYKSGHRDTSFYDFYEYEYPGRHSSHSETNGAYSSNPRSRTNKTTLSGSHDSMSGNHREMSTSRGGNAQRNGNSRSTRNGSLYTIICTEEMSSVDIQGDIHGKGKNQDKSGKVSRDMSCTEEVEDYKDNLHPDEVSDSVESSTRSPSTAKGDGTRRKGTKCLNKLCMTEANNPSLWAKEKVKGSLICKVCFDAYLKEQFCHFCEQIYLDDDYTTSNDDKDWIECESCGCWNHIQCEAAYGVRSITALLQKERTYKYFCPECRNKGSKKTRSLVNTQDSTFRGGISPNYEPSQGTRRRGQNGRKEHARPPVDDWLACEEGLDEPALTKVRVNYNREANNVDVSQNGDEEGEFEEEDITKKRLDSLFSRASTRRRHLQARPLTNVLECFAEIDKLMSQYGGKKMQLSEQEIKADLLQLKEMAKISSVQGNSEISVSEMQVIETAEEGMEEDSDDIEMPPLEKAPSKGRNQRSKQVRKPLKGREVNRNQKVQTILKEERNLVGNGKGKEGAGNAVGRMNLRIRKAY